MGTAVHQRCLFKRFGDSMDKMTECQESGGEGRGCALFERGFPMLGSAEGVGYSHRSGDAWFFARRPSVRRSCSSSAVLQGSRHVTAW